MKRGGTLVREILKSSESYKKLKINIENNVTPTSISGVIPESISNIAYNLANDLDTQVLIITRDDYRAKRLSEEIGMIYKNTNYFPKKDLIFYNIDALSRETSYERLEVMRSFALNEKTITVASIESLFNKIDSIDNYLDNRIDIKIGEDYEIDSLIRSLNKMGYKSVDMIEGKGQYSHRGGILDVFPINHNFPVRMEFFDIEVESIREFEQSSQRTINNIKSISIEGTREIYLSRDDKKEIIESINTKLKKIRELNDKSEHIDATDKLIEKYEYIVELLDKDMNIENIELVVPFIKRELYSLIDYMRSEAVILVEEGARVEESMKSFLANYEIQIKDYIELGEILANHEKVINGREYILKSIKKKKVILTSDLVRTGRLFKIKDKIPFYTKPVINYQGDINLFVYDLKSKIKSGNKIIIFSDDPGKGRRLREDLFNLDVESVYLDKYENSDSKLIIVPYTIPKGFEYTDLNIVFLSYKDIFGSSKKKRKKKIKNASKIDSFTDLKIGDYVVHENHGVGKYVGVEQLELQNVKKDYLTLEYRGSDKLYIPVDQMNLVQKYIGSDADRVKINRLGSAEWVKTKAKVKKSVEEMAKELVELYATREVVKGFRFSKDTPWQREFEEAFPYEETDDQLKATEEIKRDMEIDRPMDRLLCGDVGYGKTEVALRAIFKAVMDNKQVAFLVPTTILAEQHYKTMVERFKNFPIKIESLSRFKSPNEQKKIIDDLKSGDIDIIIGTHRILSKEVQYKDLGLLVVDEEQRFGVKQKEIIKSKQQSVDVLTLTATPIPRTLHMSLSGIRDMSVLEEPPGERYPIQTYVMEYNNSIVRDAILKEVARGGQVYLLYNKVRSIDKFANEIQKLVPEAKVAVAHGQMGEKVLEKVMMSFLEQESDVLICTTIIETGLDIPNVNTIIITDSDHMGLSQLYQLRGRVGRSDRIAFAYLMYDKARVLSEVSEKRLKTIKEFTEFGSGFKIAMRDLEIRGGGNLLGSEQHGQMSSVGYDLYVKFLDEAISRIKGQPRDEKIETVIDLNIDGYIKPSYISSEERKIETYKKISLVETEEDVNNLIDELIDIYGDVSKEVMNLINISYIKNLASKLKISTIRQLEDNIRLIFENEKHIPVGLIEYLSENYSEKIRFDTKSKPTVIFKLDSKLQSRILEELKKLLLNTVAFCN